MPALKKEQWVEIQTLYESGVTMVDLTKKFPISRTAIQERAKAKGWVKGSASQDVAEGVSETLLGVKGLASATQRNKVLDKVIEERAALVRKHRAAWTELDSLRDEIWRCMRDPKYIPSTWPTETHAEDVVIKDKRHPAGSLVEPFDHEKRQTHLRRLTQHYRTMSEGEVTKQEGERRSHGFDYKIQQEEAKADDGRGQEQLKAAQDLLDLVTEVKRLLPEETTTQQ